MRMECFRLESGITGTHRVNYGVLRTGSAAPVGGTKDKRTERTLLRTDAILRIPYSFTLGTYALVSNIHGEGSL